jgi:hypothetical protein
VSALAERPRVRRCVSELSLSTDHDKSGEMNSSSHTWVNALTHCSWTGSVVVECGPKTAKDPANGNNWDVQGG